MAAASAAGSDGGTTRPVTPSRTTHDVPEPTSHVTHGTPLASASAVARQDEEVCGAVRGGKILVGNLPEEADSAGKLGRLGECAPRGGHRAIAHDVEDDARGKRAHRLKQRVEALVVAETAHEEKAE